MSKFRGKSIAIASLLSGAMAIPLWASPALAQGSAAEDDSNTIIVTAQRRAEALEDVPMTVAVVTQETLSNAGINTVRELANVTSGFQVGNSGSYPQPAIRGITTINAGAYENNVALFVDGLYQIMAADPQHGPAERAEHPGPEGSAEHPVWPQRDRRRDPDRYDRSGRGMDRQYRSDLWPLR